jgi:hypothetical protein
MQKTEFFLKESLEKCPKCRVSYIPKDRYVVQRDSTDWEE